MNEPCRRRAIFTSRSVKTPEKVIERAILIDNPKACKKCGKVCERGLTMHMKYCKG